ncbi:WG repeat-containing protein [Thalassotalea litorea]|uniref:WG repeat-containing protein n=1 Tax=Thalassotalea litorea TaxID=2020715 RepID=A0A5R9IKW1_9GAMM|nr:WG repeat-containing protein [Thalassotalea litorea]TLU66160.1 WG repeat-containing protein [Thalassotalea litorea]
MKRLFAKITNCNAYAVSTAGVYRALQGIMLTAMLLMAADIVVAGEQKSIKPKEIRYATSRWQGIDDDSGYQVTLELNSNLSMGIVKNDPYYLCSGTWNLIEIAIPEHDALLADVNVKQRNQDIPASVLEKISLRQLKAQFALDKQNNFDLACELGQFSPSSSSLHATVSHNIPSIIDWQKLIINSIDNQYVNQTLAKDVVYDFVGTLRKDTTAKIAQHQPRIVDVDIDLSAFKIWLGEQAQQKLLSTADAELDLANVQGLAYTESQGFNELQFDRFMQGLYEQKRLNEGTRKIEQRFTTNLFSGENQIQIGDTNRTCASTDALSEVMGSWFSGTSMFQIIDKCHGVAPDYGFVKTEHCAIELSPTPVFHPIDETLATDEFVHTSTPYCPKPLLQFVSLKNGNPASRAMFLQTSGFSKQGLAAVQLIDEQWQVVTSAFNRLKPLPDVVGFRGGFHHERIVFKSSNGLYGAMDPKFNVIVAPIFEEIQSFSSKVTRVKYQGNYGVIDKAGQWIVPAKFAKAGFVENGHILVGDSDSEQSTSPWLLINSEGVLLKQTTHVGHIPPPMHALLK